ncbi:MAG: porin family protein [Cyclobacteriaceae bacterium]|nr:porin family protein [Cyclobacteriaceae bacterium]
MKKIIVMCVSCLLVVSAWAQTTQGTISLGGALGISSSTDNNTGGETKSTTVFIAPSVGYFLADGMELGLDVAFSHEKQELDGDDAGSVNETALGPYFKYYMFTANENFAFTLNASLLFGFTKSSPPSDVDADDVKGSSLQFSISPGFSYFFTDKIGLDFQLQGLTFRKSDPNTDADDDERSSFTFGVASFNPSLGFKYYFAR